MMSSTEKTAAIDGGELIRIGRIETPYTRRSECPYTVNPGGPQCRIVVDARYAAGLTGLEVGGRILVLYWLDRADRERALVAERQAKRLLLREECLGLRAPRGREERREGEGREGTRGGTHGRSGAQKR